MLLKKHNIVIPINRHETNLPMIYNSYVTSAQMKRHGPLLRSGMALTVFYYLDFFGDPGTYIDRNVTEGKFMLTGEFDNLSQLCGKCVEYSENNM